MNSGGRRGEGGGVDFPENTPVRKMRKFPPPPPPTTTEFMTWRHWITVTSYDKIIVYTLLKMAYNLMAKLAHRPFLFS